MPGVTDLVLARGPMRTRTNQGSRIDHITEKYVSAGHVQSTNFRLLVDTG